MIGYSDTVFGIGSLALVAVVALLLNRSLKGEFKGVKLQLGSVDKAVNQREKGSPTISQDVAEIKVTTAAVHELVAQGVLPRLDALERSYADLTSRVLALEHPPAPPADPPTT